MLYIDENSRLVAVTVRALSNVYSMTITRLISPDDTATYTLTPISESKRAVLFELPDGIPAGQYNYELKNESNATIDNGKLFVDGGELSNIYE